MVGASLPSFSAQMNTQFPAKKVCLGTKFPEPIPPRSPTVEMPLPITLSWLRHAWSLLSGGEEAKIGKSRTLAYSADCT